MIARFRSVFFQHRIFFSILILATVLRLYHITSDMIFVPDQGRDFIQALRIIRDGHLPLLGIPSSIPQFRQGPVYIYLTAVSLWLGGPEAVGVMAAVFGIAAVVLMYIVVHTFSTQKAAVLATLLLAFSPMAILHSRMPFHINPIPVFVLFYLWQLLRAVRGKRYAWFWAALAFTLVFHSELATFPLVALLGMAIWMRREPVYSAILPIAAGLLIGLFPQILYDITHRFSQLGTFFIWVGYRIVSAFLPFTDHSFASFTLVASLRHIAALFVSMFSEQKTVFVSAGWIALSFLSWGRHITSWKTLIPLEKLVWIGGTLLLASFIVHRAPSEAYFPGLLPFVCIGIATYLAKLSRLRFSVWYVFIGLSLFFSLAHILSSTFFLLQEGEGDWDTKRYGPSLSTQRAILRHMEDEARGQCMVLDSYERRETFPTWIDTFEFLRQWEHGPHRPTEACVRMMLDRSTYSKVHSLYEVNAIDEGSYVWKKL